MIDHNVERLDISVHDAVGVSKIECFEDFVRVEPDVYIVEALRDDLRLDVRNVFEH